ncbi:MAG TPA: hypothetical protein VJ739_17710 [Gemmataceae bacterium]|nr:hypothetical protein [Gemmataceae bacterium]
MSGHGRYVWAACTLLALAAVPGGEARAAEAGRITGTVDKPGAVTAVTAVDRDSGKRFPAKVDAKAGTFSVEGLPLGARYDLLIDQGAARLEGVSLKVPHSDYEQEQPLMKEDVEAIKKVAKLLNQFEDQIEIITVTGNIQHAAVVLNKLRTQPFINGKPGEVIWRLELWHFEKPEETWLKDQEELGVVLYRERIQRAEFDKKCLTLDPALGGIELTEKRPHADLGKVVLPGKEPGIRLRPAKEAAGQDKGR